MAEVFRMKRFSLSQGEGAMKIGTDGSLVGAVGGLLAREMRARRVLDIGTGTALIALMVAQHTEDTETIITGIEKDPSAAGEALENVLNSPFRERVEIIKGDYLEFAPVNRYDLILSNPPFFTSTHRAPDDRRTAARHIGDLTPEALFRKSSELLTPKGQILVIYPAGAKEAFETGAKAAGLTPNRLLWIRTTPRKAPKRVIGTFSRERNVLPEEELLILDTDGGYSSDYRRLLSPFLTIF